MTSQLEQEIAALRKSLLTMAGHCEEAVDLAVRAVAEQNDDLAGAAIALDVAVDRLEVDLDEQVITLLCKALLAADLRMMVVAMKLTHHLERVSDEATTIARRAILLNTQPEPGLAINVGRLADKVRQMLRDAMKAFEGRRAGAAREIVSRDKAIDELHRLNRMELTAQLMAQQGGAPARVHLMVISKCLERIADHAASIAEEVVYLCEAEVIRHPGAKAGMPE